MPDALRLDHLSDWLPAARPALVGWRKPGGTWHASDGSDLTITVARESASAVRITIQKTDAAGIEIGFAVPRNFQAFGGGERFDALDLRGQTIRYYLENFGLGSGTYLPSPFIATTLGYGLYLPDEAPAVFHIGAPGDPDMLRVQVEGDRLEMEIHLGDLAELYRALINRIGPPLMPEEHFFSLWKAGDWRTENAQTVQADVDGHAALDLPMGVKLIDAYWASEVHSFAFDPAKYPQAADMISRMKADGTDIYLWLCPWVVVGTRSFEFAKSKGYAIVDANGALITRRPGANPNIVAALIDYSNPAAAAWWSDNLRALLRQGIRGFKTDFGEQLPEHAVLHSGETGGRAHNAFVRHYLEATIAAFDGATPAIVSRSGSPRVRAPIWTGDQTSDFCPKTGLPSSVRAVQSAAYSGWSFVGSDLGGYFGTPTPQVFARWCQFACFTPLMMLHGLGCREPWDMGDASVKVYQQYSRLHRALLPVFEQNGRVAAEGGLPLIRMMPLAFPEIDWSAINDWDQQFMLGDDILVAPVAFYGNTRAVYLPDGAWFDTLTGDIVSGPAWRVHEVPQDRMPVFIRKDATLVFATDWTKRQAVAITFGEATGENPSADGWTIDAIGRPGGNGSDSVLEPAFADMITGFAGVPIGWEAVQN